MANFSTSSPSSLQVRVIYRPTGFGVKSRKHAASLRVSTLSQFSRDIGLAEAERGKRHNGA